MVVKKTEALESGETDKNEKPSSFLVLNEVVIDRGPSPYLSNIDLYLDGKHITSVQGDGLIVSTPTGKFTVCFFLVIVHRKFHKTLENVFFFSSNFGTRSLIRSAFKRFVIMILFNLVHSIRAN